MKNISPDIEAEMAALAAKSEAEIDTSDAPELQDWSKAERGKFFRPLKEQVTLRLDADVLHWFKSRQGGARGYQTQINAALRRFVEEQAHPR